MYRKFSKVTQSREETMNKSCFLFWRCGQRYGSVRAGRQDSPTFLVIIKPIKFGLMKSNLNILFKNAHGELSNSLYISLLFFNFMPKQSTHVAGWTAAFSLCEIYRSDINDNSCLMPLLPPLHIQCCSADVHRPLCVRLS